MPRSDKTTLTLQFDNPEAMNHFWRWMCESGEQQYWDYMTYREDEEDGDITGLIFNYDQAGKLGIVRVKCGRFTEYKEFPSE